MNKQKKKTANTYWLAPGETDIDLAGSALLVLLKDDTENYDMKC